MTSASDSPALHTATIRKVLDRIEDVMLDAAKSTRPLELDPARKDLFQLFVESHRAGLVDDDLEPSLTADGLCAALSNRWGLKDTVQDTMKQKAPLSGDQLAQMRSLWSVMRMWMEWTYAWDRWVEFHPE